MRVPSTVGQPRQQVARLEILVPTSDGEVRIESWNHANIGELVDHLANGQGAIYPHMLAKVYEGDVLVAVRFPQWVAETDEKLKSPRQIAWEKLSDEERRAAGRRMARAFVGLFEYDPARLKVTFAGKEIGAEGFADADYHSLDGATGRRVRRHSLTSRGYVTEPDGSTRQETDAEFAEHLKKYEPPVRVEEP